MLKKLSVQSLSNNCLANLANLIVASLTYARYMAPDDPDMSVVMVEINQYMSALNAPCNIYQDLLRVILCSEHLNANMRFTCLQLLLNGGVTLLVTEVFPFSYYEKVLQVIAAQGTGLRVLDLKGVWVKEEHMNYMYRIVRNCRQLRRLACPYIANDELLMEIGEHSSELTSLDITGDTDITEIGLEALSKGVCSQNLTVVNIGIPGQDNICYTDVALILEHCPNVQTLATYSYVGKSLKHIHTNINAEFKCKIRYLQDIGTEESTMRAIVDTCPNLESLYLNAPQPAVLGYLKGTKISKLKLHKFDCTELMSALSSCGNRMTNLTLIKGTGDLDIADLMDYCPVLVDLDFYIMNGLAYTKKTGTFKYLEGLEMLNSPLSNTTMKALVCNLTTLKSLAIDHVEFTDEDFVSIFFDQNFEHIEDVWFTLAPNLTVSSIELLMDRCPQLENVGQLSGWNLSQMDLDWIRALLRSCNSSVVFTPIKFFP